MRAFKDFIKNFCNREDGVVATIIAVSFVGLLLAILALSVDLNRSQTSYNKNYNATDAAALATAEWWLKSKINKIGEVENPLNYDPSQSSFEAYAKNVLDENFKIDQADARTLDSSTFKVEVGKAPNADDNIAHTVKVSACSCLETNLANSSGLKEEGDGISCEPNEQRVCTNSTAAFNLGKLKNVEVAFALDFTQSMYWEGPNQHCPPNRTTSCPLYSETKAAKLIEAFNYALDTYFEDDENSTAYASIVPFSGVTNLYPYHEDITLRNESQPDWPSQTTDSSGQRQDRIDLLKFYETEDNEKAAGSISQSFRNYVRRIDTTPYDDGDNIRGHYFYYTEPSHILQGVVTNDAGESVATTGAFSGEMQTSDMTYVLNRIPVIRDATFFDDLINTHDTSTLKFNSMRDLTEDLLKPETGQIILRTNDNVESREEYARGVCYMSGIVAGADQRIERIEQDEHGHRADGGVYASKFTTYHRKYNNFGSEQVLNIDGPKKWEYHESYPIQPLTNEKTVLKQVLTRFGADDFLYFDNDDYGPFDNNYHDNDGSNDNVDFYNRQQRLDRGSDWSKNVKTQSMNGLLWGWLSLNNNWKEKWAQKSVHETFCDEIQFNPNLSESGCGGYGSSSQTSRTSNELPNIENSKHLILITDGFDQDGEEDVVEHGLINTGAPLGWVNSCDSYTPTRKFSFEQYTDLCERIKKGTDIRDDGDDITIHTILYDFAVDDMSSTVSEILDGGGMSRYEACSDNFYEDVTPTDEVDGQSIQDIFDEIFLGILTDLTPVRLVD